MSTTAPTRDGEPLAPPRGTVIPGEPALHALLHDELDALSADARTRLGDEAVALVPKVLEYAMVRAWHERANITTRQEAHDFLLEQVHHGAARALSRRAAAHRFGSAGGGSGDAHAAHAAADASEGAIWAEVERIIHGEENSAKAHALAAQATRHDAAGHVASIAKGRSWRMPLALAAATVAVIATGMYFLDRAGDAGAILHALAAPDARRVESPRGQMANVSLDDGTTAHLAPETNLIIPKLFGDKLRAVKLVGTASFTVTRHAANPFEVHAGPATFVATGTKFTIRAWSEDSTVLLQVHQGTVEVRLGEQVASVGAGEARVISTTTIAKATSDEAMEAGAWLEQRLVVNGRPLGWVLPQLKRWYGVDIKVPERELLGRPVTMNVALDSTRAAIGAVERSAGVEFTYVGQVMSFRTPKR
ncbi:MAG: FecR protein [Gemmatimonadetes bacterium]|nr:FecR protein [Gemmatimonadota bacterium]